MASRLTNFHFASQGAAQTKRGHDHFLPLEILLSFRKAFPPPPADWLPLDGSGKRYVFIALDGFLLWGRVLDCKRRTVDTLGRRFTFAARDNTS